MKLLGNRVYLIMPEEKKSTLTVDENTKEALHKEMLIKMSKLEIHSVGDTVSNIEKGDVVLVDPSALTKGLLISLSETERVILISAFDIAMIW